MPRVRRLRPGAGEYLLVPSADGGAIRQVQPADRRNRRATTRVWKDLNLLSFMLWSDDAISGDEEVENGTALLKCGSADLCAF